MKTNKIQLSVFFIPLMLLVCIHFGYAQEEVVGKDSTKKEVVVSSSNKPVTTAQPTASHQENIATTKKSPMTLPIISFVLNILLMIAAFYFYNELKKIKRSRQKRKSGVSKSSENEEDENSATVNIEQKIDERFEILTPQLTKELITTIKNKLPDFLSEMENNQIIPKTKEDNPKVLYATAVSGENGAFFSVNKAINEEIVYRLDIDEQNSNRASFTIEQKAHQWILKCPEYLDNGCDVQNIGSVKIATEANGVAELKSDGKWYVMEKAKVKII